MSISVGPETAPKQPLPTPSSAPWKQIALDLEAIRVTPEPYFPEILDLARKFINKSVRRLEYEEIRRLLQSSMDCYR
jgi:hypothetical protein